MTSNHWYANVTEVRSIVPEYPQNARQITFFSAFPAHIPISPVNCSQGAHPSWQSNPCCRACPCLPARPCCPACPCLSARPCCPACPGLPARPLICKGRPLFGYVSDCPFTAPLTTMAQGRPDPVELKSLMQKKFRSQPCRRNCDLKIRTNAPAMGPWFEPGSRVHGTCAGTSRAGVLVPDGCSSGTSPGSCSPGTSPGSCADGRPRRGQYRRLRIR